MALLPPIDRHAFHIALICALPLEADYVQSCFDVFWEDEERDFGRATGDSNSYTTGVIAGHNVVLAHMPGMGKVNAANVASNLRLSYSNIKLAIVVGICGGVPKNGETGEEIVLGDVIISQALVQYDFGRQYPEAFARKDTVEDSLSRPSMEIRAVLAKLQTLRSRVKMQEDMIDYIAASKDGLPNDRLSAPQYPGAGADKLFESSYIHRHQNTSPTYRCGVCSDDRVCEEARSQSCDAVGCDEDAVLVRRRLASQSPNDHRPVIHFGKMGSGDTVMKSGKLRDQLAQKDGIIAFEMEGAGIWEYFPSIVIKGICDYADSHKNKLWQRYAAATAASCMKAFLKRWSMEDAPSLIPTPETIGSPSTPTRQPSRERKVLKPIWHVPFDQMQSFVGRENEVRLLRNKLFGPESGRKAAVFGLGGVGKSRVAWEMANHARLSGEYSVLWIQATSLSTLEKDYLEIGEKLEIPGLTDKGSDIKGLVKQRLSSDLAGKWLMILDNADDEALWDPRPHRAEGRSAIVDFLPKHGSGSVLITTRSRRVAMQLAGREVVELKEMSSNDAINTLSSMLMPNSDEEVRTKAILSALVHQLQYLPLAIVQAAAYMNINGLSISEYLQLLEQSTETDIIDLLSEDFEDETRYRQSQNSIATTWLISFNQIKRRHPQAIDLLSYISCLNEKDIPQTLLPQTSTAKEMIDIIGTLTGYSFIRRQTQERLNIALYDIHRLVRLATRNWLRSEGTLQIWTKRAVEQVSIIFPSNRHQNRELWALYMPHAQNLCTASEGWDFAAHFELLRKKGLCLLSDGEFKAAVANLASVLEWRIGTEGAMSEESLKSHAELGHALTENGSWIESQKHLKIAFEGQKEILGPEHPETLVTMGRLATVYRTQGHWADAEHLELQVMELTKKVCGPEHSNTLSSMGALASVYREQGRWDDAEKLELRVMETSKKVCGPEHPYTLASIDHLSTIYENQGRYNEAEALSTQVVEASKRVLGPEHPYTLTSMSNLALIYSAQERVSEAEILNTQVEQISRRVLGPEHPHTLSSVSNLATIYQRQMRWKELEKLANHLLEVSRRVLGPEHPDTLFAMSKLGTAYWEQKRYAEAQDIDTQVLEISQRNLGIDHPHTIARLEDLAGTLKYVGNTSRACDLLKQAVELSERRLGPQHRDTKSRKERLNRWLNQRSGKTHR